MADLIMSRDTAYLARIPALHDGLGWHGKGVPTDFESNPDLSRVLWDFSMKEAGVMTRKGFIKTGERYVVSDDDGLPVGPAVGSRYFTFSNRELFDVFAEALEGSDYRICSVLSVENRVQFAVDAVLKDNIQAGSKRTIAPFVGLHRAFGGLKKIIIAGHSTVMQCANTTALFNREAAKDEDALAYRNTGGLRCKKDEIRRGIELSHGVAGDFALAMAEADTMPLNARQARLAYVGLLTDGDAILTRTKTNRAPNSKTVNRVQRLTQLFARGRGNSGETVGDWFNGITEFYTHENTGAETEDKEKQYLSSEFGSARNFKATVAASLFNRQQVNADYVPALMEAGRASIEKTDAKDLAEASDFDYRELLAVN